MKSLFLLALLLLPIKVFAAGECGDLKITCVVSDVETGIALPPISANYELAFTSGRDPVPFCEAKLTSMINTDDLGTWYGYQIKVSGSAHSGSGYLFSYNSFRCYDLRSTDYSQCEKPFSYTSGTSLIDTNNPVTLNIGAHFVQQSLSCTLHN